MRTALHYPILKISVTLFYAPSFGHIPPLTDSLWNNNFSFEGVGSPMNRSGDGISVLGSISENLSDSSSARRMASLRPWGSTSI